MKKELTDQELETYSRQIALADIDYPGQLRLRNARACIVGMGGLGSLIAPKLTGMGIGYLRMVDRDIVSRSDLHRQTLYDVDGVGLPKVEVARRRLSRLNPDVELDAVPESLHAANAEAVIGGVDLVLDGLDRPEPRYLLNRVSSRLGIPYVFGAAIEASGNLSTFMPGRSICLECFMPGLRDEDLPRCAVVGVHPSVLGIVTSLMVAEAVRVIVGREPKLLNRLMYIDLRELRFHLLEIEKLEDCAVCGSRPKGAPEPLAEIFFEETCARDGRRNFVVSPRGRVEIDMGELTRVLAAKGYPLKAGGQLGATFQAGESLSVSLLQRGTMIVQTPPGTPDNPRAKVLELYRELLVKQLGLPAGIVPDP